MINHKTDDDIKSNQEGYESFFGLDWGKNVVKRALSVERRRKRPHVIASCTQGKVHDDVIPVTS